MDQGFDDEYLLRRHRQFLLELERGIGQINRSIIHERMPPLTREACLALAAGVGAARADYLALALGLSSGGDESRILTDSQVDELAQARRHFEELRDAFVALERAIECGYVDIDFPTS